MLMVYAIPRKKSSFISLQSHYSDLLGVTGLNSFEHCRISVNRENKNTEMVFLLLVFFSFSE